MRSHSLKAKLQARVSTPHLLTAWPLLHLKTAADRLTAEQPLCPCSARTAACLGQRTPARSPCTHHHSTLKPFPIGCLTRNSLTPIPNLFLGDKIGSGSVAMTNMHHWPDDQVQLTFILWPRLHICHSAPSSISVCTSLPPPKKCH